MGFSLLQRAKSKIPSSEVALCCWQSVSQWEIFIDFISFMTSPICNTYAQFIPYFGPLVVSFFGILVKVTLSDFFNVVHLSNKIKSR